LIRTAHFVIQSNHQREQLAADSLSREGFRVFLPRYCRQVSHAGRVTVSPRPLFPSYLFAIFNPRRDEWRRINSLRGVARLICSDERPLAVPDAAIQAIRARMDSKGFVVLERDPDPEYRPLVEGQTVRVLHGSFSGFNGLFQREDKGRVQVLVSIFGRQTPAILPRSAVEAA
jgi:transcriptional antiterminator RfaH